MAIPISYHLQRVPGGGIGRMCSFNAASDANAQTIAQSYATLFNVGVWVFRADTGVNLGGYTPGSQGTTVPSVAGVAWLPY